MKMKRILIVLATLVLVLVLAACGGNDSEEANGNNNNTEDENFNKEGMPIVNDEIEFDIFAGKSATTADDWNDVLVLNEYEKMTNIKINWEQISADGLEEKRNIILAGGDLPDAFYAANIPVSDIQKYGEQETFIALNDLIEEYAPNLNKVLEENPDIRKGLTFPDGNIYSVPTIYSPDFLSLLIGAKPWINEGWLEQIGMDNPETTDELYEVLKAFNETDLNGNGKQDEIPLGSVSMSRILHWISGAFGVQNKGQLHTLIDLDPETEELRFFPTSDDYRQMLDYVNMLYSEELIEQKVYSIEVDQFLANAQEELYGSMQFYNPPELFGEEIGSQYVVGNALEGPNGYKMYTGLTSPLRSMGNFLVTKEAEHPAELIRWIDYFYSDEGMLMFFMGIEDETFEITDDGPVLMDHITDSEEGLTLTQELAKYLINPGGNHPVMVTDDYFTGSENAPSDIEATEVLEPYVIDEPWPAFTYTEEESGELIVIQTDINKYVEEMQAQFITGNKELSDDEWDKYIDQLENNMQLEDYIKIQEQAYERYLED